MMTIQVDANRESTFRVLAKLYWQGPVVGRESTFRLLSQQVTKRPSNNCRERESTFREVFFDSLTRFDDEVRVKIELIFEVLPATQSLVSLPSLEESQHVKV